MLLAWQVRWLLGHGLDVGARDSGGATPLHLATAHLARPIMQALLAAGADVNAVDTEARSAAALCAMRPGSRLECAHPHALYADRNLRSCLVPVHEPRIKIQLQM